MWIRTLIVAVALSLAAVTANAQSLLIEDVTLIDGTGSPPIEGAWILVEGNTIAQVSRQPIEASGAQRIDGNGKYVIPGLMDVHVHLRGGRGMSADGSRQRTASFQEGLGALHSYIYSGVTTIYDSGNNPDFILELRRQERAGEIAAPRIFATGGTVTYPGSHGSGPGSTVVDDWPEAIEKLDEHIARQPDVLKLTYEERGWGSRPMIPLLPKDLLEKIVAYYNDHGIRTTVHISGEYRARQAIFAGVDALAHPIIQGPITEEFANMLGAKGVPMATTLTIGENYSRLAEHPEYLDGPLYQAVLSQAEINDLKTEVRQRYAERPWTRWMQIMTPIAQENLRMIDEAGGVLALGTDQTIGPAVHREMELLVDAGISPLDVIEIATMGGARYLGKTNTLGSIEEGKLADMVLLDANPLEDIRHAQRISTVIKDGRIIDREALALPIPFGRT